MSLYRSVRAHRFRAELAIATAVTVLVAFAGFLAAGPAGSPEPTLVAAAAPAVTGLPTVDPLPTVQIDGVAWAQAVNGNTVYAAGKFLTARPAGSAAGVNTVARRNLLGYDIRTGALITSFAPDLNQQARAVAVSPDGKRLYVGGDFTVANGQKHYRLAAYDTATGKIVTSFLPSVDNPVRAIVATNTAVYIGGSFLTVNGVDRPYLAAVSAVDGSLTGWNPTANASVHSMVIAPGGADLVVGGMFTKIGTATAYGMGRVSATTGSVLPWAANAIIRDAGANGAINSLTTDGTAIYGTGFAHGSGSNFEGTFSADPSSGTINWMEDCHGDSYGAFARGGAVYSVGHSHDCNNIGGYPQGLEGHRAIAFYNQQTTTITKNFVDPGMYADFGGQKGSTLINWHPLLQAGTYTGQAQAAWNIVGNNDYLVVGGEFPTVNNKAQQGLVRFPTRAAAANAYGPEVSGALAAPTLSSQSPGTVRVGFRTNWDRDNETLQYRVVRDGNTASPVYTTSADSTFWNRPFLSFVDNGLAAGSTHTYRIYATDGYQTSASSTVTVTVSGTANASAYLDRVRADGATMLWRLGEPSGSVAYDWAGGTDGIVGSSGVTRGAAGAVTGDTASTFNGSSTATVITPNGGYGPQTFSVQAWVKTTSSAGGQVVGFGSANTGTSPINDRMIYLDNSGKVYFGVTANSVTSTRALASSATYRDGQWHQVTGTLGPAGMRLYVDGAQVASRTDTTSAFYQYGWWRVGADRLSGYPGTKSSNGLSGSIDEVAVYPTALTAAQVSAQYDARDAAPPTTTTPTTTTPTTTTPTTTTPTTTTPTTPTTTTPTTPPTAGVVAADTFGRSVTGGFGTADTGGAWTTSTPDQFAVQSGVGRITRSTAGTTRTASLNLVSAADVEVVADMGMDKITNGGGMFVALQARKTGNSAYNAKVGVAANGAVTLSLVRMVNNAETTVAKQTVSGLSLAVGGSLRIRLEVTGSGSTDLKAKVWNPAAAEPAAWTVVGTDTTASLQGAGAIGIWSYLSGSATNVPVTVLIDNLTARTL